MTENDILEKIKTLIVNSNAKRWLTIKDCVATSNLSDSSIRRSIMRGSLKANKVGGKWLVKEIWLQTYLSN